MSATDEQASPPVDAEALQRFLDGEHAEVRARVREVLARPQFAPVPAGIPTSEYRARVFEWAKALAEEGGTGLGFPKEFGGMGSVGASIAAFETLGHSDLSLLVKCGVQFGLFGGAVLHLGTRKHHERYLSDIVSLDLPGCFAMTESGHGSNVQALETTATYEHETREFVVHTPSDSARKDYIGNAARDGRMAAVFAQLIVDGEPRGVHALLVRIRHDDGSVCQGVRIEDCGEKLGLNGVDNGRIWFDEVRVPHEALLDRFAQVTDDGRYYSPIENPDKRFFTMLGTLVQGRVSVGGASMSASKSALTIAIRHSLRRRQFGPPDSDEEIVLLDYSTHQRRLLPALAKTYGLHFAQEQLVAELHRVFSPDADVPDEDRRELETRAAGVKAVATWHATHTIQTCREACGGAGYLAENRFAALKADTDVFTTFEGDNTVLLQLVAKGLLTGYRDHFGELDPLGTVAFVAGQVFETVAERSAARELLSRLRDELFRSDDEDLFERDYHRRLLAWREDHLVSTAARRLKRGIDEGYPPFEVFRAAQDHIVTVARAHVERVVLEAFTEAVDRCEDAALREVLDRLCDLYALATVEAERGWFQEHGRISSTRAKAVTRGVNQLCLDLRPDAGALVDAFGIPDAVLAAPIGLREPAAD